MRCGLIRGGTFRKESKRGTGKLCPYANHQSESPGTPVLNLRKGASVPHRKHCLSRSLPSADGRKKPQFVMILKQHVYNANMDTDDALKGDNI